MISGNGLVQPFLANDETALFRMELKRVIRKLSFNIGSHFVDFWLVNVFCIAIVT